MEHSLLFKCAHLKHAADILQMMHDECALTASLLGVVDVKQQVCTTVQCTWPNVQMQTMG